MQKKLKKFFNDKPDIDSLKLIKGFADIKVPKDYKHFTTLFKLMRRKNVIGQISCTNGKCTVFIRDIK